MKKFNFIILLLATSIVCQGQSHLESGSTHDDPFNFMFTFNSGLGGMQMFDKGLDLGGRPAASLLYAKFSSDEVESIYSSRGSSRVIDTYTISNSNKEDYRDFFFKKGNTQIPILFQLAGLANAYVGAAVTILGVLDGLSSDRKVNASALAELMEEGGVFKFVVTLEKVEENYFANAFTLYNVSVSGKERNYVLSKSRFPVKIE